ncbi:MAG: phosphotransferase [Anaerolineales bacterium]|nr:phosphotransferase [Anaerolineales bacterium]
MALHIRTEPGIELPAYANAVLQSMFADYHQLVIKKEFGRGFSGGRVFLLRPIRSERPDLPAVVKMGPAALISREWDAFQAYIRHRLPNVANIEGEPIFSDDNQWGGLRYPLVGNGLYETGSLLEYALGASIEDMEYALNERLFKSMSVLWDDHTPAAEFPLRASYDAILPVNLVVAAANLPSSIPMRQLSPQTALTNSYQMGELVMLDGFRVTEVDREQHELTLNLAADSSFRMHVRAVPDIAAYQENQLLAQPLTGAVIGTRQMLLQQLAEQALGSEVNLAGEKVFLPDGTAVSNPLHCLPDILRMSIDARVGSVHGDLNLENVLVEYDQRNCVINLIDFASARRDHVLHDFLRLETGFLLYLLPQVMTEAGLTLDALRPFLEALHLALGNGGETAVAPALEKPFAIVRMIRRAAQPYLSQHRGWTDYYHGLTLYLLGALKFKNLDTYQTKPKPKVVAFWTAALVQHILKNPPQPAVSRQGQPAISSQSTKNFAIKEGAMVDHRTLLQLFSVLDKQLNETELQQLCFMLGVNYSDLPGQTRALKIQELLQYLNRRHRVAEMVTTAAVVNDSLDWPAM